MPRTRRATKDTAADGWSSSSSSSASASASGSGSGLNSDSEVSDSNVGTTPPPKRTRRVGAQTPVGSPAANTRRSSRLSAQSEQSPKPKQSGRLTRGLRGGAKTTGSPALRSRSLKTRAGVRGGRRAISSPTSDEGSAAKPERGAGKRGRLRSQRNKNDDDDDDDNEEEEDESSASDEEEQDDEADDGSGSSSDSQQSGESDTGDNGLLEAGSKDKTPTDDDNEDDSDGSEQPESAAAASDASDAEVQDALRQVSEGAKRQSGATAKPAMAGQSSRGGRGRGRGGRGPGRPRANPQPAPLQPEINDDNDDSVGEEEVVEDDSMSLDGFSDIGGDDSAAAVATNLTRRQRAKLTQDYDEELIELPLEAKRSKFSAEEAALRKSEHARRRKFQSMQRAEQLKNDTINRLLNKQTSKGRNKVAEDAETRSASAEIADAAPGTVRYIQRRSPLQQQPGHIECSLSLARDVDIKQILPAMTQRDSPPSYPQPIAICSVTGCSHTKKYSVASLAACSLEHWRILNSENNNAQTAE
ncbi:INO80 complex subunit B [Coemansia asiatica]|uniref:INO80 complex subunit B n=1 Tax=Coemansia asiatica TaxID=1052880 RepID=A0A9W8CK45_9FUNG|nr:INO80 complex subunit B [Coemansia asiatica]